jgi:hypothetical protein
MWAFGHDVRPAAQSLGVKGCTDCHAVDSAFMFAKIEVDSPLAAQKMFVDQGVFQKLDPLYEKAFALSFIFRPWLKLVSILSSIVLFALVLMQGFRSLADLLRSVSERLD